MVLDIGNGFAMDDFVMRLVIWILRTPVLSTKYKVRSTITKYEVPNRQSISWCIDAREHLIPYSHRIIRKTWRHPGSS
jgi:hypothetical protein